MTVRKVWGMSGSTTRKAGRRLGVRWHPHVGEREGGRGGKEGGRARDSCGEGALSLVFAMRCVWWPCAEFVMPGVEI